MVTVELKENEYLVHKGETAKGIYIVLRGSINLKTEYYQIPFGLGSVIGVTLGISGEYVCDYIASENSLLAIYPYGSPEDYKSIFKEQPKYSYAFLHAAIKQYSLILENYKALVNRSDEISNFIAKQYSDYEIHCAQRGFDVKEVEIGEFSEVFEPEPIQSWEMSYFSEFLQMPEDRIRAFYHEKEDLIIGVLIQIGEITSRMLSNMDAREEYLSRAKESFLCEDEDLLELWYDLAMKYALSGESVERIDVRVTELEEFAKATEFFEVEEIERRFNFYKSVDFLDFTMNHPTSEDITENETGEVAEILTREQILGTDFTTYIMKYAGYGKEDIRACKMLIAEYDQIAEVQDYTPRMQTTRRALTKLYYEIYERAFLRAVKARTISTIMKLFFNFGVLDLKMAGENHLDELVAISELFDNQWKEQRWLDIEGENLCHVYSVFQWLCLIYHGEKEPSKNEFDIDYAGYLLEQRKNHKITREQENELKHDAIKKIQFEIHNMFMSNNRITYGRITTFCPVLHRKDFIRSIDRLIVSPITIHATLDHIRSLDYSCFYREVFFASPNYGIQRTEIMKEVLPDVILMPNIGSKGMMWQETAGVKRDTPARFVFPILTSNDMSDMMLETVGRYRWEICRKILGVRWNDIREKSLTSEFYDYIQFYRKNRELSQQAKEKVKAELVHAKNNYREVFVSDYIGWMKYESQGSFRLNKVSRRILAQYVPFKEDVQKKLEENPMFQSLFEKSRILASRKKEKEKNLFDRYIAAGGAMTPEIQAHLHYYGIKM